MKIFYLIDGCKREWDGAWTISEDRSGTSLSGSVEKGLEREPTVVVWLVRHRKTV